MIDMKHVYPLVLGVFFLIGVDLFLIICLFLRKELVKREGMKRLLLLIFVFCFGVVNMVFAEDAKGDLHAVVMAEGGYAHSFGDMDLPWDDYFSSFQRQMRNGYSLQAEALACFAENLCAGAVVWQKGFDASDDGVSYKAEEKQVIKYIGPMFGVQEYMGPGLIGLYLSAGFVHFSDKYSSYSRAEDMTFNDRFVRGAFGYLVDLKYHYCLGKHFMVGPSIGYYGFQLRLDDNGVWALDQDYLSVNGFVVTASIGVRF